VAVQNIISVIDGKPTADNVINKGSARLA